MGIIIQKTNNDTLDCLELDGYADLDAAEVDYLIHKQDSGYTVTVLANYQGGKVTYLHSDLNDEETKAKYEALVN